MNNIYIIAEAGVNHNGSLDLALKLCDSAKYAGADAVKFQTFITEKILTKNVAMAGYQADNLKSSISQFEMVKQLELTQNDFIKIKNYCESINIEFLSTPDEEDSLKFLMSTGMQKIKVGSGDLTNIPFLRKIAEYGKEVLLSTGMATMDEIEMAYKELKGKCELITLLHCTTNYPCPYQNVNLKAMLTLKDVFKTQVGYSDHTMGIEVSIAAAALGASVIEKHLTLDRHMPGPDHKASIDKEEFKRLVESVRNIEKALGSGIKQPTPDELKISKLVRKNIVASCDITQGDLLTEENLTVKRSSKGLSAICWDQVVGTKASKNYKQDEPIEPVHNCSHYKNGKGGAL